MQVTIGMGSLLHCHLHLDTIFTADRRRFISP